MSELTVAELLAQADEAAELGLDLTEVVSGGQSSRLLPQGYAFAQLVEYTEYGNHPQEFKGAAKDPALEVQLGFALTGAANVLQADGTTVQVPYNNEDGSPYILRLFPFAVKQNDGARSFKLFKLLNWEGLKKNFGQLIGKKWVVKVVHEARSQTDATLTARLDLTSFLPPRDPISGAAYPIADADLKYYRLFLWDKPTKAAWDKLYIEPSGKVKNFVQEKIMSALNFEGSPLQQLLAGGTLALPTAAAPVVAQPVAAPAAAPVAAPVIAAPAQPAAAPVVAQPVAPLQPAAAPVTTVAPAVAPAPVLAAPIISAPSATPALPG